MPNAPIFDQSALELTVRAPTNALSFSFDSAFLTREFPSYVCDVYNDFFVVLKEPRAEGAIDANVLLDAHGDPISVNTGLFAVCNPDLQSTSARKRFACEQGPALLKGTGFDTGDPVCGKTMVDPGGATLRGGSTGWLRTTVPIRGGEVFTLRFAIWDTHDAIIDSTALVDNFRWSVEQPKLETKPIVLL
jgi:hypothetical protein